MALNKKFFPKVSAAADVFTPSEHFNTVLYTGNGSTQRIGGYINRGALFNGSSSKIDLSNLGLGGAATRTISAWINVNSLSGNRTIFQYGNSAANNRFGFAIEATTGKLYVEYYGRDAITSSSQITVGSWFHVVATYNGGAIETATNSQIYVNGSAVSMSTTGTETGVANTTDSNYGIGYRRASSTQYFNGKIDQVRLFNKALSSSEVTTLYGETYASTTISTTDIFSDDSGVALYQLDGNANDTGGVTGRTEGTESAIFSNADNSNFNLGNATVVNNSFGVSFWVKMNKISQSENVYLCSFMYGSNTSLYMDTSNVLQVANGGYSRNESFSTTHTFAADTWYHIVYTGQIVGDGTLRCYVNGTQVGSRGWINGHNYTLTSGNRIGSYNNGDQSIDGQIADFRIYKSTHLSSGDVTALYSGTPPTTGLTEYYKFNGNDRNYAGDRQLTPSNVIYNYSGTATNVTYQEATKFQPDLVWIKHRNHPTAHSHNLADSVRGATKLLYSNTTDGEETITNSITSFDSNGFTIGNSAAVNGSPYNYVAWCFNAGTDAAATNNDGTIASTVKANTDAGFSIVSYTGNGTSGSTIGHGLSDTPQMMISKRTDSGDNWNVYTEATGNTGILYLNLTDAFTTVSNRFNNTSPTSTVFTVGNSTAINVSGGEYIAYCFHSVAGYSAIGSYTGNGSSSGTIVETGFEPAFVMIKRTDGTAGNWFIFDNERSTTNERDDFLHPNSSATETTNSAAYSVDFLSNGFQIKGNGDQINGNNGTHIYLAIAADPDTTTPVVENSFDVVTYTGDGTTSQIIDVDFKPDLVWVKARGLAQAPNIFDSIRGGELMRTSLTSASGGDYIDYIDDGFQFKATDAGWNQSGQNYVAWAWKAGDHDDNLPQINTEGSIDSVVSVNAAAGFSIVKGTAISSGAFTVGHGLSAAPELYIIKNTSGTGGWLTYVQSLGADKYLSLNTLDAAGTSTLFWNNTAPSSTVFQMNAGQVIAGSADFIAYCFHSVSGYQKVGSYTGTGSSGNSVTTGFRPRFVMVKKSSGIGNWVIKDSQRDSTNPNSANLYPNLSNAENTVTTLNMDLDNNGFTLDGTSGDVNGSGQTYIYLAIA